ncbi:MAG: HD domain-containing protein [Lachnospiraceae bacterium]|nr:HD domain-containing protein [Lachnospiraceae bacterium]
MDEISYKNTVMELANNPLVLQMAKYVQHGNSTTYQHSVNVAIIAGKIAKKLHIKISAVELARGAMLHDFFLYDIHGGSVGTWEHGFGHASVALENACKHFDLTDIEKDIIYTHMWPLNITRVPGCKESVIVGIADKISAVTERIMKSSYTKEGDFKKIKYIAFAY